MTEEQRFEEVAATFRKDRRISQAKMFGAPGLRVDGKVFAMLYKGRLVLKLPEDRVSKLVTSRHGEYFDPGHGRVSKGWLALGTGSGEEWAALVKEAREFVAAASPKKSRKKSKR